MDAKRGYRHAIDEFVDWYCSEPRLAFNRIVVLRYRSHLESRQLAPGTINLRLSMGLSVPGKIFRYLIVASPAKSKGDPTYRLTGLPDPPGKWRVDRAIRDV